MPGEDQRIDKVLHFSYNGKIRIAQVERYVITYSPDLSKINDVQVTIKNKSNIAKRATYLAGPFLLYVDVRTQSYTHKDLNTDIPKFEPNLQPGLNFVVHLNPNRLNNVWIIDVVSQLIFSSEAEVDFDIQVTSSSAADDIKVERLDTDVLWNTAPPAPEKPIHLVVLTHGLHSNIGADMLYIKEQIESVADNDNIIVRGYPGNVCKTECGIKFLGMRVGEYIISRLYNHKVERISFVGHSLGGLIQMFCIAYIEHNYPWFFQKVRPMNFITLASPLLGITETGYIQKALSMGVIGRSGVELSLTPSEIDDTKCLLELLPTGATHRVLTMFNQRTCYANILNDAIVPLRTAAILYLDYQGILEVLNLVGNGNYKKDTDQDFSSIYPINPLAFEIPDIKQPTFTELLAPISNPVVSLSKECAKGDVGYNVSIQDVSNSLVLNQKIPVALNEGSYTNILKEDGRLIDDTGSTDSFFCDDIPSDNIGQIPKINQTKNTERSLSSFFQPLQDSFAAWVTPQAVIPNEKDLGKASMVNSAKSLFLPKLPSVEYITNPEDRYSSIVHDRLYTPKDICRYDEQNQDQIKSNETEEVKLNKDEIDKDSKDDASDGSNINKSPFMDQLKINIDSTINEVTGKFNEMFNNKSNKTKLTKEEEIAKKLHEGLSWRKVLVKTEEEAHNNIIVRRRFVNAYGWQVIDHLVAEHFVHNLSVSKDSVDEVETEKEVMEAHEMIDNIYVQTNEDFQNIKIDDSWINCKNYDVNSVFQLGAAGFLSNLNNKFSKMM